MKPLYFLRPGVRILLKEKLIAVPGEGIIPITPASARILEKLSGRPLFHKEIQGLPESMSRILLRPFQLRYENPKALGADYIRCKNSDATSWVLKVNRKTNVSFDDFEISLQKGVYLFPLYRPQVSRKEKLIPVKSSNPRKAREEWLLGMIKKLKVKSVLELGCGDSRSLEKSFLETIKGGTYFGIDKSIPGTGSRMQSDFLKGLPDVKEGTVAVAEEVIEHLKESELPGLLSLLQKKKISSFILTTPNQKFTRLMGKKIRHHDHKFEWSWNEVQAWAKEMSGTFSADIAVKGIGRKWKGVYPTWGVVIKFR